MGPKSGRKMKIDFVLRPPEKCLLSFELYSRNGDTIKVRDIFFKGSRGWVSRRKGLDTLQTIKMFGGDLRSILHKVIRALIDLSSLKLHFGNDVSCLSVKTGKNNVLRSRGNTRKRLRIYRK